MRTFLARCSTLGVLAGGFMLTGDAGWLIARGTTLLNATSLPTPPAEQPASAEAPETAGPAAPWTATPATPTAPTAAPAPPAVEAIVNPTLATPTMPPPADGGLTAIDLRLLRAGDRVVVWVGGMPAMYDIVDPAAGEAIQQPQARRVTLGGVSDSHRLVRGGMLRLQPLAGITGHAPPPEQHGPVQAIAVR